MVIIPAAAAVIAATAAAERPTYPQKEEAPRERCLFRFRGIGQPGGANRAGGAGKRRIQPAIKIFKKICVTLLQNTRK